MLALLASGQLQTRQDMARLLGVHRLTVGPWLACDAIGDLASLLDIYVGIVNLTRKTSKCACRVGR
jgi:hypothetical protein